MIRSLFWVEVATLETIAVYKSLGLHFPHVYYFAFTNTRFHLSLCCPVSQELEMFLQLLMGILVSITMNNSASSANFITLLLSVFSKSFTSVFKNTAPSWKSCRTLLAMLFHYQNQAILFFLSFNQLIIHKSFWILCWKTLLTTLPFPLHQLDHSTTCSQSPSK